MQLKPIHSILVLITASAACAHESAVKNTVPVNFFSQFLNQQSKDWNRGDLEGFCSVYAKDAVFISPSGRTIGRQAILERYQKKYDTPEKRGQLELQVEHEEVLGNGKAASVILRWEIRYPDKDNAAGWSMIVLKQTQDQWLIIKDASM